MYAELEFVRPDGSIHKALAFVDMGSPSMVLTQSLFQELEIGRNKPLVFRVGELTVEVPGSEVGSEAGEAYSMGSDLKVEGTLAASVLQRFQVVLDYQKQTLTLARPRTLKPEGVAVPFQLNQQTGLIAVDTTIDDKHYFITIDNGSAYTWVRQTTARQWLAAHPDWERGVGAVGVSNMMMSGDGTEISGVLMRIPKIPLGSLQVTDVGVLAAGHGRTFPGNLDLFDWYSRKNAVSVIGWIGGSVLKNYRLMIDYPNGISYWLKQSDSDTHYLDQVGLTLESEGGVYRVAAVAAKYGKPTVDGILPGDTLIRIGKLEVGTATWGTIYAAMHGKPGDIRTLVLERNGQRFTVKAKVTAF